jgi:hypothetical protein
VTEALLATCSISSKCRRRVGAASESYASAAGSKKGRVSPASAVILSTGLPIVWRDMSREGLAAAPDCHVVWRGEAEASAVSVRWLRLWQDRGRLAVGRPLS